MRPRAVSGPAAAGLGLLLLLPSDAVERESAGGVALTGETPSPPVAFAMVPPSPAVAGEGNHRVLATQGEVRAKPSWVAADPQSKTVRVDVVAGFNANNGALNYNGYFAGDMTLVVPLGWKVEVKFRNQDAMLPHSLLVTRPFPPDRMPDKAGIDQVAIPRAYTVNPEEGIPASKGDTIDFTPKAAGDFYFFCGAPDHGKGGMWTRFKVDPDAAGPSVIVDPKAAPGRE